MGHLCTASIIGDHTILTAAHCLERLGQNGNDGLDVVFNYEDVNGPFVHIPVIDHKIHPQYSNGTMVVTYQFKDSLQETKFTHLRKFDYAVLKLGQKIPSGFMAAKFENTPSDLSGELVAAYGAGVKGNIADAKSNAEMLKLLSGKLSRGLFLVRPAEFSGEDFFTVEGQNSEQICGGDSGGPQFLMSAATPTIVGLNSARISTPGKESEQSCGTAAVVARVSAGASWITEVLTEFEK